MFILTVRATFNELLDTNSHNIHRKPLIEKIQDLMGGAKLVVYIANPFSPAAGIMIPDIPPFEDLLRSIENTGHGILMINSLGGDGNTAEKILHMCRKRFTKSFKVIVPDYAKSAATMIALGSDEIIMGYLSELGPIDPQFRTEGPGPGIAARSLIDGLEVIREKVRQGDPIQLYYPMLSQIRPEMIARAQSAIDGSREFAEKWLKRYQLREDHDQAENVSRWLSEGNVYKSHGKVIDVDECRDVLKLNISEVEKDSELWDAIWELYCRSIFFLQQRQHQGSAKLFENEKVSMVVNVMVQRVGSPTLTPQPPPRAAPPTPLQPPKSECPTTGQINEPEESEK